MSVEDFAEAVKAPPQRIINLFDHDAASIVGPVPPIEWLVEGTIPLAVPALVASLGGVGKSMTALQLCLRVTEDRAIGNVDFGIQVFGGQVVAHGSAAFVTTEDNRSALHRRLAALDPDESRSKRPGRLFTVALPDAGGPLALFTRERDGTVRPTDHWLMICDQLCQLPRQSWWCSIRSAPSPRSIWTRTTAASGS